MIQQEQLEQTDHASKDRPMHRLTLLDPVGMALAALVFFGASWCAAYVVTQTNWNLVVKLYAGVNGVFFALLGLVSLTRALRDLASRFPSKPLPRVWPDSRRETLHS
jgi:hypothetical protein